MTNSQAFEEAKFRWGNDVKIERVFKKKSGSRHQGSSAQGDAECWVGTIKLVPLLGSVFVVKGTGQDWEEAFKYADRAKPVK